ncbi:hypothetical protein LUZ60_014757 [Juncus effusus]|nr:hypothetical protein LUZ60_014757 [Juncus effusus]
MAKALTLLLILLCAICRVTMARPLGVAGPPTMAMASEPSAQPEMTKIRPDKSIAGAEVILGGFATALFAVIFIYIRVTRKNNEDGKI